MRTRKKRICGPGVIFQVDQGNVTAINGTAADLARLATIAESINGDAQGAKPENISGAHVAKLALLQ